MAHWWLWEKAAGTWTPPMIHAQLSLRNHKLKNGDKITLGGKDQGHRVTETCRRISHRGPAPQHFLKPIWEYSSTPLPQG